MLILPYSAAPVHPTIPTSLDGLSKIIFGDGSQTIQLADTQGRTLFQADGSLNTDPATRLPQATPFPVLDSTSSDEDIYLCGGNGPFVQTLRALQAGGYSVTLLHPGLALRVEADATNLSLPDEITLDPQASRLGFHTGEARKALRAQLLTAAPDGDVRSAIVATSSFQVGTSSCSFDPARQTLTYQHSGPATECIVTLEGTTRQSQRATFVTPPLHMTHGDRASMSPDDWHRLRRTTVTLTVTHQDGTQSVRKLKNHKPDADSNEDDTDTPPHRERE